jgi:hypothetical protein
LAGSDIGFCSHTGSGATATGAFGNRGIRSVLDGSESNFGMSISIGFGTACGGNAISTGLATSAGAGMWISRVSKVLVDIGGEIGVTESSSIEVIAGDMSVVAPIHSADDQGEPPDVGTSIVVGATVMVPAIGNSLATFSPKWPSHSVDLGRKR